MMEVVIETNEAGHKAINGILRELLAWKTRAEKAEKIVAAYNSSGFADSDAVMEKYLGVVNNHREIIDQGRKVLNATSDKGMSHTDFIEWALERLGE